MAILSSYSVLGESTALQAAGADIVLNDHMLSITSCPSMDFRKIIGTNGGWLAPVSATAAAWTVAPVAANSTTYSFLLQQDIVGSGTVSQVVSYTSLPSGDTTTTISTALKNAILANSQFKLTVSSTTSVSIAGSTTNPAVRIVNLTPVASNLVCTNGTPLVMPRGQYSNLIAAGVAPSAIATGHTYNQIQFVFVDNSAGDWIQNQTVRIHTLYVYASATNFAAFNTAIGNIIQGLSGATTYANPEAVSVNS